VRCLPREEPEAFEPLKRRVDAASTSDEASQFFTSIVWLLAIFQLTTSCDKFVCSKPHAEVS
jgi:hypothetical protein